MAMSASCEDFWICTNRRSAALRRPLVTRHPVLVTHRSCGWTLVELLIVISIIALLAGILLPAIQMTRRRARDLTCTNNLFQIGLALNNYHDAHRTFPPGYVSAVGPLGQDLGPGWSWAAMILPQLEQSHIYDRIRFEEGVDAPANASLAKQRVEIFMCPADLSASSYVACYGQGDMTRAPDRGEGVFFRNSRIRQRDIEDGAMTILIGERSSTLGGAEWAGIHPTSLRDVLPQGMVGTLTDRTRVLGHTGAPGGADPVHPPNEPALCGAGFGSMHTGGANFLMLDGSVRFLKDEIDRAVYAALATRAADDLANEVDF